MSKDIEHPAERVAEAIDQEREPDPADADTVAEAQAAEPAQPAESVDGDPARERRRDLLWGELATSRLDEKLDPDNPNLT